MSTFQSSWVGHGAAILAAATMTIALLSSVISLSEPHRSQLVSASASKHSADKRSGDSTLASQQHQRLALRCHTADDLEALSVGQKQTQWPEHRCY
jgi:hypothetical protein